MQSGYSAPAMVLGALALINANPNPSEADIRDMLSGILDRETAYVKPVEAILRAAAVMRGEEVEPFRPVILEQLTDGQNSVEIDATDPPVVASAAVPRLILSPDVPAMSVVGKPEVKVDALRLAKGNPAFTDDIEMHDMLYAKVLRSPHAHAKIVSIDDHAARELPGVHAVLHHENVTRIKYASGGQSYPNPAPTRPGQLRRQGPPRR